jgi:hypothetical protein
VGVGLEVFCAKGQRLLGLGGHLAGRPERLIRLTCFPLAGPEDGFNRLPGHRVRRLFMERRGNVGRLHFLDGTPTALVFDLGKDEPEVLHWVGLSGLGDGERLWFDLAASPVPPPDAPADEAAVRPGQGVTVAGRVWEAMPRDLLSSAGPGVADPGAVRVAVEGNRAVPGVGRAVGVQGFGGMTAAGPQSGSGPGTPSCPRQESSEPPASDIRTPEGRAVAVGSSPGNGR